MGRLQLVAHHIGAAEVAEADAAEVVVGPRQGFGAANAGEHQGPAARGAVRPLVVVLRERLQLACLNLRHSQHGEVSAARCKGLLLVSGTQARVNKPAAVQCSDE